MDSESALTRSQVKVGSAPTELQGPTSVYSKLQPNTIRVFELMPADDGAPIAGLLRHVHMGAEHVPYQALSYVWGDSKLQKTISCDGITIGITKNLHRILSQLRRSDVSLVLWVDALCIDQGTDNAALQERAQQITMMNHIFATASRVVIDLGETTEDFGHLLAMLEQYTIVEKDEAEHVLEGDITLPSCESPDTYDLQMWHQLLSLIQLPWFERLWCFQEFILAREIATMVGSCLVTHFDLHLGITRALYRLEVATHKADMSLFAPQIRVNGDNIKRMTRLLHRKQTLRWNRAVGKTLKLEAVVVGSRCLDVTDPRDRIYAVYALLPNDIQTDFDVDYNEAVQALQQRLSIHLIQKNYALWVLMYAIGSNQHQPSWTMSLSVDQKLYWNQEGFAASSGSVANFAPTSRNKFRASGLLSCKVRIGPDLRQITAEGCVFDRIVSLSDYHPPQQQEDLEGNLFAHVNFMINIWQWADANGTPEDILWRLLVFDGYGESRSYDEYQDDGHRDQALLSSYQSWKIVVNCVHDGVTDDVDKLMAHLHTSKLFLRHFLLLIPNMRLAMTERRYFATVPYTAGIDDKITILSGAPAPFVLRETGPHYQLVAPCYVHGLMEGQALHHEDWKLTVLTIV